MTVIDLNTDAQLHRLDRLSHWMDDKFRIPGTGIRFGLDGLVGLIPGVGDSATFVVGLYIIAAAWRLDAPRSLIWRMIGNSLLDALLGAIPLIGDVFDVAFKANRKNVRLLREHIRARTDDLRAETMGRDTPRTAAMG